jgi:hypothetical protein
MAGKDSGLRIRVERPLREAFLEACRVEDRPAAQVIREFMREFVAAHGAQATDAKRIPVRESLKPRRQLK